MKTYQVTLNDESAALVDKMLQDGPWDSIDELFLNGIGTLQEDVAGDEYLDVEEIREKLRLGQEDIDAGRIHDGEEVFRELFERIRSGKVTSPQ